MLSSLRLAAFACVSLLVTSSVFALPYKRDQLCNGHAELCDRKYGNVTFLGSHDSFADSGNPLALARTQEVDVSNQLTLGVRMLQAQAHMNNGVLHFCHTSCMLFDGGSVQDYFHKVKYFLDRHPNEVLTFIFANPENIPASTFAPIFNATGLANMTYVPPQPVMSRDDWPTLGEMIASKQRIVVFMDKGAESRTEPSTKYILPEFQMVWEDKYDPTDSKFPCKVDRTEGPLAPNQQLSLINHNLNTNIFPIGRGLLIPDRLDSPRTNSVDMIEEHAANCAEFVDDRNPNFVLLDYVNVGLGLTAVNKLNGFKY